MIYIQMVLVLVLLFLSVLGGCTEAELSGLTSSTEDSLNCTSDDEYSYPATFCQFQQKLILPKCVSCHTRGSFSLGAEGSYDSLMGIGWAVANNLDASKMFVRMEAGDITNTTITDEELEAVGSWILDGAPNN